MHIAVRGVFSHYVFVTSVSCMSFKCIKISVLAGVSLCAVTQLFATQPSDLAEQFVKPPYPDFSNEQGLELWQLFGVPAESDFIVVNGDTLRFDFAANVSRSLTEKDYIDVANELGVEVAAIKAVVYIETGRACRGFNADDSPVINFDVNVFRTMAARRKIKLADFVDSHPLVFNRQDARRYGGAQVAEHKRLQQAMSIDTLAAIQSTFWGMFQIGGFNWKRCGTSSPDEFVNLMSLSEREQLRLFARFIAHTGLLTYLKSKDWTSFARGYNGPSYAKRGYHRQLEAAYNKFCVN